MDFRPLTAIAVGGRRKSLLFFGASFRGVPLHTTQETEFLDFLSGNDVVTSPDTER